MVIPLHSLLVNFCGDACFNAHPSSYFDVGLFSHSEVLADRHQKSISVVNNFFSFTDLIVNVSAPNSRTLLIRILKMVCFIFEIIFLLHNIEFKIPIIFLVSDIFFSISIADEPSYSSIEPRYLKVCIVLILSPSMKKSSSVSVVIYSVFLKLIFRPPSFICF